MAQAALADFFGRDERVFPAFGGGKDKVEFVHQRRWATRDEAGRELFAYIEGYYTRQCIHSALGYLTPEKAERTASESPCVREIRGGSAA